MTTVYTPRLLGRELRQNDFSFLRRLHTDALVMAELGGVRDEGKTKENLVWNLAHWERHGFGLWFFSIKENGLPIGLIGIREIEFLGKHEADLAFMLLPQHWKQGFAKEASLGVLALAFREFGISSVIAKTRTSNLASQQVIQRLGFSLEGEIIDFGFPHFLYRLSKAMMPYPSMNGEL